MGVTIEEFLSDPKKSEYDLKREWNAKFHEMLLSNWSKLTENHIVSYVRVLKETNLPTCRGRLRLMKNFEILEVVDEYIETHQLQQSDDAKKFLTGMGALAALKLCQGETALEYSLLYSEIPSTKNINHNQNIQAEINEAQQELEGYRSGEFAKKAKDIRKRISEKHTIIKEAEIGLLAKIEANRNVKKILLQNRKSGWAWMIDSNYDVFYFDGLNFSESPMQTLSWVADEKPFYEGITKCDEEAIYWSGKNVFFALQRYGNRILCMIGKYYAAREEALMEYSIWFIAKSSNEASAQMQELCSGLASGFKKVNNFFISEEKESYSILRSYTSLDNQFDTDTEGVWNNHWIDDTHYLKSFKTPEDAIEAFQAKEMELIKTERFITGFTKFSAFDTLKPERSWIDRFQAFEQKV